MTDNRINKMSYGLEIHIGRVPRKTHDWFKTFSDEEFCSDFGMALKHLVDFYVGLIPSGVEHLEEKIIELESKISELEQNKNTEKKKRVMANGREIRTN